MIYSKELEMDNPKDKFVGMSFYTSVMLGVLISQIQMKISNFFENKIGKRMMLEDLKLNLLGTPEKEKDEGEIINEIKSIKSALNSINKEIGEINKDILDLIQIPKKISLLNVEAICKIIQEKLLYSHKTKDTIKLVEENFKIKLSQELDKVPISIKQLFDFLSNREKFDEVKNTGESNKSIREAINIYSSGYGKTAVLCMGRTIEKVVNNYLKCLLDNQKITSEKYDELIYGKKSNKGEDRFEPRYQNKIGFLKGGNFLNDEEFLDLRQFACKRNKGGHPDLGEIDNQRAKILIQQGIFLIIDLQNRIKSLDIAKEEISNGVLESKLKEKNPKSPSTN
jgi:hypothetical protein